MTAQLVDEIRHLLGDDAPARPAEARRRLCALLTTLPWDGMPAAAWPHVDALWAAEAEGRVATPAGTLPRLAPHGWASRVSHWHGDLTTLSVGAIVNAANSGLTGCYLPFHACVDNAIHTAAGPRLREECGRIMASRGRPEPTSTATTTRGWFLPARHVVHTVGPIVPSRAPGPRDEAALADCYTACLEATAALDGERSVAFCGISTGVFGYPPAAAAPVALASVRSFLEQRPEVEHVVLVTFTRLERNCYQGAIREALP